MIQLIVQPFGERGRSFAYRTLGSLGLVVIGANWAGPLTTCLRGSLGSRFFVEDSLAGSDVLRKVTSVDTEAKQIPTNKLVGGSMSI